MTPPKAPDNERNPRRLSCELILRMPDFYLPAYKGEINFCPKEPAIQFAC